MGESMALENTGEFVVDSEDKLSETITVTFWWEGWGHIQ